MTGPKTIFEIRHFPPLTYVIESPSLSQNFGGVRLFASLGDLGLHSQDV